MFSICIYIRKLFSSLFPIHVSVVYNLIRLFAYGYTAHIIISALLNFFNKRNAHTTPLIIAFAYTAFLFDFCPNLAGLYRTNSLVRIQPQNNNNFWNAHMDISSCVVFYNVMIVFIEYFTLFNKFTTTWRTIINYYNFSHWLLFYF